MKRNVIQVTRSDVSPAGESIREPARGKVPANPRGPDGPAKGTVEESGNGPPIKRSDGQVYGG